MSRSARSGASTGWPARCTGPAMPRPSTICGSACPPPPSGRRRATTSWSGSTMRRPRSATATRRRLPSRRWRAPTGWSGRGIPTPPPGYSSAWGACRGRRRAWSGPGSSRRRRARGGAPATRCGRWRARRSRTRRPATTPPRRAAGSSWGWRRVCCATGNGAASSAGWRSSTWTGRFPARRRATCSGSTTTSGRRSSSAAPGC